MDDGIVILGLFSEKLRLSAGDMLDRLKTAWTGTEKERMSRLLLLLAILEGRHLVERVGPPPAPKASSEELLRLMWELTPRGVTVLDA